MSQELSAEEMQDSSLAGQRKLRIYKLQQLKQKGLDGYPAVTNRNVQIKEVVANFDQYLEKEIVVAGRLKSWRKHGKLLFGDLADESGQIQLYIKHDEIMVTNAIESTIGFEDLELIDAGDIVEVEGTVTKTMSGEQSILVKKFRLLTKTIRPLPTELEDKEDRFRRRYLDMNLHPEIRDRFKRRAAFWQATRDFLNVHGFTEINIPVLEHVTGGADAKPFVTHYDALGQDLYLRISHELPLKRLIGAGFEKVYDIGPRFRNEGISDEHLPEHIAMEFYWAYADYRKGMELTKEMFKYILEKVYGTLKFNIRGFDIDLNAEWQEIKYIEIIKERFGVDVFNDDLDKMLNILKANGVDLGSETNRPRVVDNLWKIIRKTIPGPAFLIDEPKAFSPLAKSDPNNPEVTQRFHVLIAGSELANAYSELNDPIDQLERFLEQQNLRDSGDDEAQMLDIDFVEMLEYGMPPTVGFGMSERVFWFFENVTAKEGVPFPQLKSTVEDTTRKIYPQIQFEIATEEHITKPIMMEQKEFDRKPAPPRPDALAFLHKYVADEYQRHHAEMVEIAMRAVANHFHEDEDRFGILGLIHDWDFDKWPTEHPGRYDQLQSELGVDDEFVDAIKGHADLAYPRQTKMAQALMACDEFSGLMYAYMKMVGNYKDMKTASIRKKMYKDLNFAAKINREDILTGVRELGIDEEKFYEMVRDAFAKIYDGEQ